MKTSIVSLASLAAAALAALVTVTPASAASQAAAPVQIAHHDQARFCGARWGERTISKRRVARIMYRHGFRNIHKIRCRDGWYVVKGRGKINRHGHFVHARYKRFVDPYSGRIFKHKPRHWASHKLTRREVARKLRRHGYRNIRSLEHVNGWYVARGRTTYGDRFKVWVHPHSGQIFHRPPRFAGFNIRF